MTAPAQDEVVARLAPWLTHHASCKSENNAMYVGAYPCDCGLDAALAHRADVARVDGRTWWIVTHEWQGAQDMSTSKEWFEAATLCGSEAGCREHIRLLNLGLEPRNGKVTNRNISEPIQVAAVRPDCPTAQPTATEQIDARYERTAFCLAEMMQAYERRIRSECKTPEELSARPWECREWLAGADALKKAWPAYSELVDEAIASIGPIPE